MDAKSKIWFEAPDNLAFLKVGLQYLCTHDKIPKMPEISALNGLLIEEIPDELQLNDVENQLIAKNILFMKLKKLPRSRMQAMVD